MEILIQSPRIGLNRRMQSIIRAKFARFENVSDRIIRCEVVLKKEKDSRDEKFVAEARLIIPGNDLFAKEKAAKFEIAAEEVCLDLERQLAKRKTQWSKRTRPASISASDEEME
jgi:putative sigma-54 modulation protein